MKRKLFQVCAVCFLLLGNSCSHSKSDTAVTIEYDAPLQFVVSGWGTIDYFEISGPDRRNKCQSEWLPITERYWQIAPLKDINVETLEQAGPITYGKLPPGFRQVVPEHGEMPPILETNTACGYTLKLAIRTGNGHSVNKTFAIRDGKVVALDES